MKLKLFLFLLLATALQAQVMGPKLKVLEPTFDFGDLKQGTTVKHDFVVTNAGDDSLVIMDIKPGCGCTAVKPDKNVLKPGESTKIGVEFNTTHQSEGEKKKYVYVYTNDPENSEFRLVFTANVLPKEAPKDPKISFNELLHDFGKVKEGDVVNWTVGFSNVGGGVLEIQEVKASCGCTAAVASQSTLKAGEKGSIKVDFNSKGLKGNVTRNITVRSNDSMFPETVLTFKADIVQKKN